MPLKDRLPQSARRYGKPLLVMAIPIMLQTLLNFAINLLDSVMLGTFGEVQIAAASLANQMYFVLSLILYGTVGGSNVMVSQFWGKKDIESIGRVMSYTYRVGLGLGLMMTVLCISLPRQMLSLLTSEQTVIEAGIPYLQIVACSYLFSTVTLLTSGTLRAVRDVRISLILSVITLCVNGSLNYILIFGKLGFAPMGIRGAAIATLCARVVEFGVILYYVRFREQRLRLRFRKLWRLDKSLARTYVTNTAPVICNEVFWSAGSTVLTMIIGHMSTEYVAANSIFGVINQLSGALAQGLCAAAAVMIGNAIGSSEKREVMSLARFLQWVGALSGLVTAGMILVLRPLMLNFYNVSELTIQYTNAIVYTGAFVALFRNAQSMNMMGILRGGGDARFVMVNDVIFLWALAVPLGYLTGLVWHAAVPIIYCALNIEQFIKFFTSTARLRTDRWITNVTAARETAPAEAGEGC